MEIKKTSSKIMGKKILALMLTVVMVTGLLPQMTMPVQADGEVYGVLQSDGNVYETDAGNIYPTTTVITDKKTVTHLYAAEGVKTIAAGAFNMCDKLISIDLPAVTSIGNSAFLGCTELTTIDLPTVNTIGNSAFLGCFELTAIDLPEVVVISDNAFNGCKNLTTVKLPRVTSISNNAFKSCTSFDNLTVGVAPPTVGTDVFAGCLCANLTIDGGNTPAAVEAYENAGGNGTWYGWLLSVTHYPLTVVGGAGSGNYGKDTTVTITAAHLDDGQYFKEWTVQQGDVILADPTAATTNFTMPGKTVEVTANYEHIPEIYTITYATNGINVIGAMTSDEFTEDVAKVLQTNAFIRDGYSFKNWNTSADGTGTAYADGASFTATANTTLYAQWTETTPAVAGYGVLRKDGVIYETNVGNTKTDGAVITDKKTVTHLYAADDVTEIKADMFFNYDKLTTVDLPAVTSIGNEAFYKCEALTTVNMLKVTSIGDNTFAGCSRLTTVNLPVATSIGFEAFLTCTNLTKLDLPAVTSIAEKAFSWCDGLTEVNLPLVTSIGVGAFNTCGHLTTVDLPMVTSLGDNAFYGCDTLANLTVGATPPTSVGTNPFEGCSCANLTIDGSNTPDNVKKYEDADSSSPQGYWYGWALPYSLTINNGTVSGATTSGDYRTGTTVTITAADPADGQRFKEWTVTGEGVTLDSATTATTTFTMPGNAVAVTANYEAVPVTTISFDANEGTGTMSEQKISEGTPQALNKNTFTRAGFSFARWDTKPDGTGTDYADGASFTETVDTTLYAQWTETTPAVAGYGVLRKNGVIYETNVGNTKTDGAEIDKATVKATVTHLFAADDVTSIGDWTFCNCAVLTTVTMPKVTSIGDGAFNFCEVLSSVEMPAVTEIGEDVFTWDAALTHLNVATVTTIGKGAFASCEGLETVEIPVAISIGEGGFYDCRGLTTINMPKVTAIGRVAFGNDAKLTTVEMSAVTAMDEGAFAGCSALTDMKMPEVTSVGKSVFSECTSLATVEMPKVTSIGTEAFNQCLVFSNLTVGAIPPTVGTDAFKECKLTTLTIAGGNTSAAIAAYEAADTSTPNGYWYGWALSYPLTVTNGTGSGDYRTGTTVTITAATPEAGQRFTNWTVAGDGVTFTNAAAATTTFTMPGNAVAVSANYEAIPITSISYAANSGAGDMTSQQISAGSPQNLSANAFTRVGYSFKNWNTSADGSGTSYADSAQFSASVTENIILYAQWTNNKNTFTVSGTVADSKNQPVSGAEVKLMQGNVQIGVSVTTDANGGFTINNVPNGNYNLVVVSKNGVKDDIVVTTLVSVDNANYSVSSTIILPAGTMNSAVEVKADTPEIVVGNLEKQFNDDDKKSAEKGDLVEIRFTAEEKDNKAPHAEAISTTAAANSRTVGMFIDFSVLKTINSSTPTPVPDLLSLIEVLIPLDPSLQGKTDYVIYRYHGSAVDTITTTEKDGEKIELIDGGKTIKLTAKKFSTYAIAYDEAVPDPGPGPSPSPVQTYTLTYNENSGIGTMKDQVFTEGTKQALVKNTFERTGYTFAGWNTKQDGTGTAYADGADFTAATSTLYAQWTKNEITVPDGVSYRTHVQNNGWESSWAADGNPAGTEGQSLRLEGIEIKLTGNNLPAGARIEYRTHVQNSGWENDWSSDGQIAGTVGQSLRLEAIQIRLVDMPGYSVEYRTHVQNRGWETEWASDGESAGTEGQSLRLEAIEIRLVKSND